MITFNPRKPNPAAQVRTLSGSTLEFLTCPTTHLCVAAGYNDGVIVLNPDAKSRLRQSQLPSGSGIAGISCPAASACVVLTLAATKVAFNPAKLPAELTPVGLTKRAR